ncbi:NPCBM/NEW2 domain-containing protein, partial [Acinetobacter baumannii]
MNQEWGAPQKGKTVDSNPLKLNGHALATGVGTHAHSEMSITLDGKAKLFTSTVGVDDETGGLGTVRFMVYGDNALLADSGVMKGN